VAGLRCDRLRLVGALARQRRQPAANTHQLGKPGPRDVP
jgi:hypothetical protein